ncbi:MAG: hypothetical protein J6S24_06640 [Lentisphaeria bacterium]|nr:hypothetical protein [Lentisphaeria bacterium]MBO5990126.1 hypothetical protein [Lentisphaeria bacterium]MBO7152274.1 hypothetical protein [Lentisphaeria bacterium]
MANVIEKNLRTLALNGAGEVERAQLRYIVNNSKAADDDRALLVQVLEGAPENIGSAKRSGVEILDCRTPDVFEVGVNYVTPAADKTPAFERGGRRDGDRLWSIRTGTMKEKCYEVPEKQKMYCNEDSISISADYAPFWNGRFGEDAAIGGIDKIAPKCEETCRRFMYADSCNADFRKKAVSLVGKLNSSGFRCWSSGEVMCTGVDISEPFSNDLGEMLVEMRCTFTIRRHRKDVTWCGIEVGRVKGWEHLWGISYAEPQLRIIRGAAAFVGRIYDNADFGILGLEA